MTISEEQRIGQNTVPAAAVHPPQRGRSAELVSVEDFLIRASTTPSGLVVAGEPGIGKTTLWLSAVERARERGFRVLSARPAEAESVLAYASLADLLGGVDSDAWAGLPDPQRLAVDRALLRAEPDGAVATDHRAVSAGFLAVINGLADESPVLLAIDDVQWLDPSSAHVVSFIARRLSRQVGVLVAVRTGPEGGDARWLQLPRPDDIERIRLGPLSLGALHAVIVGRLGRSFPRPKVVRIFEISGGNPFYALELARELDAQPASAEVALPATLADLVRSRIGRLEGAVQEALLAAACAAAPTVDLVALAIDSDTARTLGLIEDAENEGVVGIEGHRIRFTHPLLARGVYTAASPADRRRMHHRLAAIVEQPELRARHLALAAVSADALTLQSLDAAAELAGSRGAPAAAAELLDLAAGLGGDTPERLIKSANQHFKAGDLGRARVLLDQTIERLAPGPQRAEALNLLAAVRVYQAGHAEAAGLLERGLAEAGENSVLRVHMLVALSMAFLNIGNVAAASDRIEDAVSSAERLGQPQLLSQSLGIRTLIRFMRGDGLDEDSLRRALELEDRDAQMPVGLRPSLQNVLLLACTGQLDQAGEAMVPVRRDCLRRCDEFELTSAALYGVLIGIWRGNFADAAVEADDAMERATQFGGDLPLFFGLAMRAALSAYAGRVEQARSVARDALAAAQRSGASTLAAWTIANAGFLEVSLGEYEAALSAFAPLLAALDPASNGSEILLAGFLPDAAEALIQLGRLDDAEPLIAMLERNGERLDRAWMLAVGGRCRAMLWAAQGDLGAASLAVQRAMAEHDRLPMPFERARTQLLLGQLQRRQRQKEPAAATLREALKSFEDMGTPLWAERVRAELARTNVAPSRTPGLTPSEQRVAELAGSGMTNRDVAAALFISPKTVEVNLSRVYRKLGIRSRAELGRYMANPDA